MTEPQRARPLHSPSSAESGERTAEGRGAFAGFIGPRTLVGLVRGTAPYLFAHHPPESAPPTHASTARLIEHGFDALGWWRILLASDQLAAASEPSSAERADYFALCLAAHFASAATYVPTDVDAKIRHALWFEPLDAIDLRRMHDLALQLAEWDMRGVSARIVDVDGFGPISGHDGERLSVMCGGMLALLAAREDEGAAELEHAIDAELAREARAFDALSDSSGRECELLALAAILTHNAGDVNQGLTAKSARTIGEAQKRRFVELAQQDLARYGGAFARAAELYRELLASEGHRNYPLREVKLLRADPALLLPIGPFLDEWGAKLARWPAWNARERAEVVTALVEGCRKVRGQESYYRALAGFDAAHPGGLEARELVQHYGTAVKHELKSGEMRRKLALRRESFESSYKKRTRAILQRMR
jgi:hypothetical protein